MFFSAGSTFILYLLIFFRLRGNITVLAGYRIHLHRRPQFRFSRASDGTYIMTNDRDVQSHLVVVARRMLRHPISYIMLVLPLAATRFSAFSGTSVPFPVVIFSASLFALIGFVNVVLFCSARNGLSGGWRQRTAIAKTSGHERSDVRSSSWGDSARHYSVSTPRMGAVETGRSPVFLSSILESDVETVHEEVVPSRSFGYPTSPTWPLRAYRGRQRTDSDSHHTGYLSFLPPFDERMSVQIGTYSVGEDGDPSEEVHPGNNTDTGAGTMVQHSLRTSIRRGTVICQSDPVLEAPAPVHPLATAPQLTTNTRRYRPASVVTFETAVNRSRFGPMRLDFDGDSSSTHWTRNIG